MSGREFGVVKYGDIGHGVTIEARYVDGELHGFGYDHPRPGSNMPCGGFVPAKPHWGDGWDVLSPSLLCLACGHHGFVRDGKWVPA